MDSSSWADVQAAMRRCDVDGHPIDAGVCPSCGRVVVVDVLEGDRSPAARLARLGCRPHEAANVLGWMADVGLLEPVEDP